ncbi:STAS domain-containing protein [Streptomyces sp. NBC_00094]|uniref:STAS domain-containing protein n=1 Tax=Streptomyces sp. NBC_00094 TaxID=2903620 RepID=UPI00224DB142|nr:STAS domain-containing protein [Streptomyces sp. NBC_00094]MCX5389248.1 STAS domain-containing protein [Streptomyces sp. NBC_00094]
MQLIPRHDPHLVVRSTGGHTVAALHGELDLVLVRHLRPELDALVRESQALTLDIRRLTFCDATGLGLLAHCAGRTQARGARWRLVCDQPWILRLIRLTALGDLLRPEATAPGVGPTPGPQLQSGGCPPGAASPGARPAEPGVTSPVS